MKLLNITQLMIFFITHCFEYKYCWMDKKSNLFVYELSVFPNSTSRIGPIKFKIGMLNHVDNTFEHIYF